MNILKIIVISARQLFCFGDGHLQRMIFAVPRHLSWDEKRGKNMARKKMPDNQLKEKKKTEIKKSEKIKPEKKKKAKKVKRRSLKSKKRRKELQISKSRKR